MQKNALLKQQHEEEEDALVLLAKSRNKLMSSIEQRLEVQWEAAMKTMKEINDNITAIFSPLVAQGPHRDKHNWAKEVEHCKQLA